MIQTRYAKMTRTARSIAQGLYDAEVLAATALVALSIVFIITAVFWKAIGII